MPVESAADRASFFDKDEFAEAAQYTAPGPGVAPVPCSLIIDRGQARTKFDAGEVEAQSSNRMGQAYRDDLPEVHREGLIEILDGGGNPLDPRERYKVTGMPQLDETGEMWVFDLLIKD